MIFEFRRKVKPEVEETEKVELKKVILNDFYFAVTNESGSKLFIRSKKTNKVAVISFEESRIYSASNLSLLVNEEVDEEFIEIFAVLSRNISDEGKKKLIDFFTE